MEVTRTHVVSRPFEHARNLFGLAEAMVRENVDLEQEEATAVYNDAIKVAQDAQPEALAQVNWRTEAAYDDHVPIFWRLTFICEGKWIPEHVHGEVEGSQ